jgi:pyroglutamyl-peptidase
MAKSKQRAAKPITCLITGFDAFGKTKYNPSELVVKALPETLSLKGQSVALAGSVLPTCCKQSWTTLKRAWKSADPQVIVMCGMAESRERISIERFALNILDYRIADNSGHQPLGKTIEAEAPDALRTLVPVEKLQKYLQRNGYPCEVSNHAGTFVCNDVYFRALHREVIEGAPRLVLFVHLPMPARYAQTVLANSKRRHDPRLARSRKLQVELLTNAVLEIARFCTEITAPS